jgi:hypothetical protein
MSFKTLIAAAMVMAFPASALAGAVMLKNKDGKETSILVKRSNSTTKTAIAGKATMEIPGAPVTITVEKTGSKIEALDGETVTIEKGKLSKLSPPPEEGDEAAPAPPDEVPPPPPTDAEKAPAPPTE